MNKKNKTDWRRLILILLEMIQDEEKLKKIYLMMNRIFGE